MVHLELKETGRGKSRTGPVGSGRPSVLPTAPISSILPEHVNAAGFMCVFRKEWRVPV